MHKVVAHHFGGGVYAKHVEIPEDYMVFQHKHKFDHLSILASGCAIVGMDGHNEIYYAPAVIEIKAGVEHAVTAVNGPAVWFCIHATNETNEENIDAILIEAAN